MDVVGALAAGDGEFVAAAVQQLIYEHRIVGGGARSLQNYSETVVQADIYWWLYNVLRDIEGWSVEWEPGSDHSSSYADILVHSPDHKLLIELKYMPYGYVLPRPPGREKYLQWLEDAHRLVEETSDPLELHVKLTTSDTYDSIRTKIVNLEKSWKLEKTRQDFAATHAILLVGVGHRFFSEPLVGPYC